MIIRCLRAVTLLNPNAPRMMRGFATAKKNYYEVLGVTNEATLDEIKSSYRNLAKRYHPDVNASGESYEGDPEKFRDVVEAYQVLSIQESRTIYDLQNQAAPDFIYRAQRMEQLRKYTERGRDGNPIKDPYPPGSYAEHKREFLAQERKKFNVDKFGRYKGGVPQKRKSIIRGTAMGYPGAYHDPQLHNMKINPDPDSQFVTSKDALAFKYYMQEDKYSLQKKWIWFQAKVDYDFFKFETYRIGWRWFRNILFLCFALPGLANIYLKAHGRRILKQAKKLAETQDLVKGIHIQDRIVKRVPSGIIRTE